MFDRCYVPQLQSLSATMLRGSGRRTSSVLLTLGLAVGIAVSGSLAAAFPGKAYAADPAVSDSPSIQYKEALAHAGKQYSFTPGGPVTVPFRPRPGDTAEVDGAAPVALPAGEGSGVPAPSLLGPATVAPNATINVLRREVYGFLPYWEVGSALDYSTLSTVAYFGVGINVDMDGTDPTNDGALARSGSGWSGWQSSTMTSVINGANAAGTRVALTIESFAWDSWGAATQTHLLTTPAASQRAVQQIAAEVKNRGAGGVNLDFEPIAPGMSSYFVAFVRLLRAQLDLVQPGYELTFCATGRPSTYDLPNLLATGAADAVFIMGYNLRGGRPTFTGSIDPLVDTVIYDLTDTVNVFLRQVPASKVILGLPWYGEAWSTGPAYPVVYAPPGDLTLYGYPAEVPYSTSADLAAITDSTHIGKQYENSGEQTAWTAYYGNYGGTQNSWRELYFDDSRALGARLDAIDGWNLRGAGIWALGYDNNNGDGDLTATISDKWVTTATPATYVPISPVRLLDTRAGNGLGGKLLANTPATFQVTSRGIPPGATAITGNVTAVNQSNSWAVYLGPKPIANPVSSTVNFSQGQVAGNGLTVALGPTGSLSATFMSTAGNTTDLVLDVTGYFMPDSSGATYHAMSPARLLDTRVGNGLGGKLLANTPATFQVGGRGGIPANATAITGNVTVVNPTNAWAVYLGPDPVASPGTSTINFNRDEIRGNGLTVALSTTGYLSVTYMSTDGNTTDLVLDVTGYYTADATGTRYVPLTPARMLDTRAGNGLGGKLLANTPATFPVAGRLGSGIPANASAVTGNVTVVNETNSWAVFLGPDPVASPTTSTINFNKGDVKGNGLTVALSNWGSLSATYVSTPGNVTDLVFDVTGFFIP